MCRTFYRDYCQEKLIMCIWILTENAFDICYHLQMGVAVLKNSDWIATTSGHGTGLEWLHFSDWPCELRDWITKITLFLPCSLKELVANEDLSWHVKISPTEATMRWGTQITWKGHMSLLLVSKQVSQGRCHTC